LALTIPEKTLEKGHRGLVCTNIKQILSAIQKQLPNETNAMLASKAGVNIQTISKWKQLNRANDHYVNLMIKEFFKQIKCTSSKKVLLLDATPQQLFQRCAEVGWGQIINSGKMEKE